MAIVDLPDWAVPNAAEPALLDFGGVLRPSTGAALLRVDRPGSRYKVGLTFPPVTEGWQGNLIVSRLIRGKRMGLRTELPLLQQQYGMTDGVAVDGAGQAGTTLLVRGLTPWAIVQEGYWLSIVRADGRHYLHNAGGQVQADATGRAALPLSEMLRSPFADGAQVKLARPMIEGIVDGDEQSWRVSVELFVSIECTIEEAA